MPPSFPYGGMENPCLTFVTPTLLAGDRSLADVVAHEITHSWTGNLVTNLTWRHFWLNEGWTMFIQRKITASMKSRSNEQESQLDAICKLKSLTDSVNRYGLKHEFTKLIPDLTGVDPDDSFSTVPYEKGFNFLYVVLSFRLELRFNNVSLKHIIGTFFKTLSVDLTRWHRSSRHTSRNSLLSP